MVPGVCHWLLANSGVEVTLLYNRSQDISFLGNLCGVQTREMKSESFSLSEQVEFIKIIAHNDFYWATSLSHPIFKSCRVLATVHDVAQLDLPTSSYNGLLHKLIFWFYFKSLHSKSKGLAFNSKFTRDRFKHHFPNNDIPEAITHLGSNKTRESVEEFNEIGKERYFVTIGNNRPHKNLPFMISSFLSNEKLNEYRLKVIGSNADLSPPPGVCKTNWSRIEFLGYIPDCELENQITHAQALFFPSLYEGFGLPAIEALSLGCPVIASNNAALPEICGDVAIYFDPRDRKSFESAIDTFFLAIQGNNLNNLSSRCRMQASKFSWNRCIEETSNLFVRILNCPKSLLSG